LKPALFTLTGNLLAERTLTLPAWEPSRTQRAVAESFQVGGKGINVSRMLHRLGVPSTALCFTGGAPGAECDAWLESRQVPHRSFATTAPTRVGTVIREQRGLYAETTFLGPDTPPDADALRRCADFLEAQPDGAVLAVCGSVPGWASPGFAPLRAALNRWSTRGLLVADTYGPPLPDLIRLPLALLRLNADELRWLHAEALGAFPGSVARWVISDGPRAVTFGQRGGPATQLSPPGVTEISPTGCGDVMLAALIDAIWVRGLDLPAAVAYALPLAAANAAHPGVAEFELPARGSGKTDPA
jgi:1-phosphofructokinase